MHVYLKTPIGSIKIIGDEKAVSEIQFIKEEDIGEDLGTQILQQAKTELEEYFLGERTVFSIPLSFRIGTVFQQKVWDGLIHIPFGKTKTYGQLAQDIGVPRGQRAVGGANNKNPIPIIVPCHRVVAKSGIGGFALGEKIKKWLLDHEKSP